MLHMIIDLAMNKSTIGGYDIKMKSTEPSNNNQIPPPKPSKVIYVETSTME